MKKTLLLAVVLLSAGSADAQSSGYYEYIPYYNNDPFEFCTVGVPWEQQYARVCPRAFTTESS